MELKALFQDIAAAIREQEGSAAPIPAKDFPERIRALQVIKTPRVYGVRWDGSSSTALTRTDEAASFATPEPAVGGGAGSSPFDSLRPWSGMVKSEDGAAGTVVAIPKFWYKWTVDGTGLQLQVADSPVEGFSVSPSHADRGDGAGERDVVYIGRYHCAADTYRSTPGAVPASDISRAAAREAIHNLGPALWQCDFALFWTVRMLYLVEFADWNCQAVIGAGCGPTEAASSPFATGGTDGIQYHTGTPEAGRSTYGSAQYRNIEGLWDNVGDWVDGMYYDSKMILHVITDPSQFDDTSGGTALAKPASGFISAFTVPETEGLDWALYPRLAKGSSSTYVPDNWVVQASKPCVYCGGDFFPSQNSGLFHLGCGTVAGTGMSNTVGCRLMKLP